MGLLEKCTDGLAKALEAGKDTKNEEGGTELSFQPTSGGTIWQATFLSNLQQDRIKIKQ